MTAWFMTNFWSIKNIIIIITIVLLALLIIWRRIGKFSSKLLQFKNATQKLQLKNGCTLILSLTVTVNLCDIFLLPNSSSDWSLAHFWRLMIGVHVGPIPDPAVIHDWIRTVRTSDWTTHRNLCQTQTFQVYFEIVLFELFENSMEMIREMKTAEILFWKIFYVRIENYFTEICVRVGCFWSKSIKMMNFARKRAEPSSKLVFSRGFAPKFSSFCLKIFNQFGMSKIFVLR